MGFLNIVKFLIIFRQEEKNKVKLVDENNLKITVWFIQKSPKKGRNG